jgi:alpha-galactosidase
MPDSLELWVKPLKNNELALCFFNRTDATRKIDLDWKDLNISDGMSGMDIHFDRQLFTLRDLWAKKELGKTEKKLKRSLDSHDVLVLRLKPE